MRVGVAVGALAKRQASVAWLPFRVAGMTLLAFHRLMQSGKRVARFRVVEFAGDIFPIIEVVALQAVLSEAPFVRVFMAGHAGGRNTEKRSAQFLRLDLATVSSRNLFRQVALVTR